MFLVVRPKSGRAEALAPSVRAAISRVDKEQLVSVRNVMTLEDIAWEATGRHRFRAVMVMAFAALALVLAMVGVFGILAYSVQQQRARLRRAPGARRDDRRRASASCRERRSRHRRRGGHRAGARGRRAAGCIDDDAVRRAAAGSDDVRGRDDRAGPHRRAVDRGSSLAGGPDRSGGRPEEHIGKNCRIPLTCAVGIKIVYT